MVVLSCMDYVKCLSCLQASYELDVCIHIGCVFVLLCVDAGLVFTVGHQRSHSVRI